MELQHVLLNLLSNAVEASGAGGEVRIADGDPVTISVSDDSAGIAPEDQKRFFEPFFSSRKGRTGLGLYISSTFVRRWGGAIRVRSAPGAGLTFEVLFPPAIRPKAAEVSG